MVLATVLSGCAGGLVASTPPDTYGLSTAPEVAGQTARNRQILISEPTALKALDSEQIVIRPTPSAIQYLAKSQWSDRLPNIVQDKLVQAFENSGQVGGVGRPGDGLAIDYKIITAIRAFEIKADAGEQAVVEISAKVLNDRNGVVLASKVFRSTAPVSGSSNAAYVQSLDRAFEVVVRDMVGWTLSRI
ncbi:ABC-type transport auxiliary lipoprotein family protein [Hoeflea sp. YIM 152468]|uniref:ABC-type transport auxiliary lipoprotein family protein n=1 Tax=Hoeflea sp. YIM 152468 TaxID=3031759 RepID=UPI0023DCB043|nr:ABC-type transport auxiliary lipoprotein family protein [Hoeflea sp. YIM 152468]MDF1607422.1 ABC-type transport auxiliary lipoprotein family protein [Hoeflea sp. YIM 152468]